MADNHSPVRVVLEIDPQQMALRGRIGGFTTHSRHDSREVTKAARATFLSRFEREVDPDSLLSPEERQRRAEHARRAYFARLALLSSKARRMKKAAVGAEAGEEAA